MLKSLALITALAMASSLALAAPALDAQGKCRDGGKFVAAEKCKMSGPASPGRCRDKTTKKFAKCDAPNTEPVPK